MRVNIEDHELSSYSIRKLGIMLKNSSVEIDYECLSLGYLVKLWHNAINHGNQGSKLTIGMLSDYMMIFDETKTKIIVEMLVECGYLKKISDETYAIGGKEKDFKNMKVYREKAKKLNDLMKERSKKPIESSAYESKNDERKSIRKSSRVSLRKSIRNSLSDQIRSDQIKSHTNTDQKEIIISQCESEKPTSIELSDNVLILDTSKSSKHITKPSTEIRNAFDELHIGLYGEKSKWGIPDYACANKMLTERSLSEILEMIKYYFVWPNEYVIRCGHSFSGQPGSFYSNQVRLRADMLLPQRHAYAKKAEVAVRGMVREATRQDEVNQMLAMLEQQRKEN